MVATWQVTGTPVVVVAGDESGESTAGTVRRFYTAVADAITTGDTAGVEALLTEDYVDHTSRPATAPGRDGFLASIRSLHQVAPAFRPRIVDLVTRGDRAAMRLEFEGVGGASFLGIPLPASLLWDTTEAFRVDGDRIAEHWGGSASIATFAPMLTLNVPIAPAAGQEIRLERWTYAPGAAETRVIGAGFLLLWIDAGELSVAVAPPGQSDQETPAVTAHSMRSGETVAVPANGRVSLRNDHSTQANVIAVIEFGPAPGTELIGESVGPPGSIVREVLAGAASQPTRGGIASVAIGRVELSPGSALPAHLSERIELVSVEAGSLVLEAPGGAVAVSSIPGTELRGVDGSPIHPGGGARIEAGATVGYHAGSTGPLALLIVTVDYRTYGVLASRSVFSPPGTGRWGPGNSSEARTDSSHTTPDRLVT